jgi:hypothetical protein
MTVDEEKELHVLNFFRVKNDWATQNEMMDDFRRSGIPTFETAFYQVLAQHYLDERRHNDKTYQYKINEIGLVRLDRLIKQAEGEIAKSTTPSESKSIIEKLSWIAGIAVFFLAAIEFYQHCSSERPSQIKSDTSHSNITINDNSTNAPVNRITLLQTPHPFKAMPPKPRHLNAEDKRILDTITADHVSISEQSRYGIDETDSETFHYAGEMLGYFNDKHRQVVDAQGFPVDGPPPNANGRFYIHGNEIIVYRQKH